MSDEPKTMTEIMIRRGGKVKPVPVADPEMLKAAKAALEEYHKCGGVSLENLKRELGFV